MLLEFVSSHLISKACKGVTENSLKSVAFLSDDIVFNSAIDLLTFTCLLQAPTVHKTKLSGTKCCDEMNLTEAPILFHRGWGEATDFSFSNYVYYRYKEILQYAHGRKNMIVLRFSKVGLMLPNSQ